MLMLIRQFVHIIVYDLNDIKKTCFLGYVTTVAWRVKTQHFTKPNHTLGKHCDITENTAALTCFGLCEYGGPRWSKDITENIFQKTTVYKTKQKTKISEKNTTRFRKTQLPTYSCCCLTCVL